MKKVYLAGFDVFYADGRERGNQMKQLCQSYELEGLYPLDNEASSAKDIFMGNLSLIDQCDAVAANINPFRGDEPDSGTAFEIGYAYAKGKAVYAYLEHTVPMIERLGEFDKKGFVVENFGLPVNLMIGCSVTIVKGGLDECLLMISRQESSHL